jgi:heat shock protein HtpX
MGKRIFLFLATNLAIVITLSIVLSLLGVGGYMGPGGLDIRALAIFCFIWGMGGAFISLQMSRWIAKRATGVQVVDGRTGRQEQDWLYNTVARLTQQANLPMPEVGIYDSPEVNAFATGPSKSRSLVAVSSGLLRSMRPEEVEGVLAHEVAHISNGDMVTMTLLQGIINAFVMFFARLVAFGIRSTTDSRNSYMMSYLVMIVLEIGLGILGSLITAWFSRHREFRADAGGAALAGRPQMIAALRRLMNNREAVDTSHQALATLKINGTRGWMVFFSTHPPLEQRITALENLR